MFVVASDAISEEAARRELWISFASLVRSYLAAVQIAMDPAPVMVLQPDAYNLELVTSAHSVHLTLDAGKAEGYWAICGAPSAAGDALLGEGAFRIGMDGLMEWTGLPGRQEMDAVAEALATLILE